jgi:hypothetical protein
MSLLFKNEYLKTIRTVVYPTAEEQTNRFTIVRTTYAFRDGRTDI